MNKSVIILTADHGIQYGKYYNSNVFFNINIIVVWKKRSFTSFTFIVFFYIIEVDFSKILY